MTSMASRKLVQEAVDLYFAGKITVDEAFRRAYGPDPREGLRHRMVAAAGEPVPSAGGAVREPKPKSRKRRKK